VQAQVAQARALQAQAVQAHPLQARVQAVQPVVLPELPQRVLAARQALSLQLVAAEWADAPVAATRVAAVVVQVAAAAAVPLAATAPTWIAR
jgi:hypothetical protein